MPIPVYCQQCAKEYRVKDTQAGMRVRCPNGHVLTVPLQDPNLASAPREIEIAEVDTMARDFRDDNPYLSPGYDPGSPDRRRAFAKGKVAAPAIVLIGVGGLGLALSLISLAFALFGPAPQIDPEAPEFVREFQRGAAGPLAALIQAAFVAVNAVIVLGAIQMLRFESWGLAVAASILAIVNIGSCCCVVSLPVGIWSLLILMRQDVGAAFAHASR